MAALEQVSGYQAATLCECVEELRSLQQEAFEAVDMYSPLMAVKEKYRDVHWHCVSQEAPAERATLFALATTSSQPAVMAV